MTVRNVLTDDDLVTKLCGWWRGAERATTWQS